MTDTTRIDDHSVRHLQERVRRLEDAEAIEALLLLADDLGPLPEVAPPDSPLLLTPEAHRDELVTLARAVLSVAAESDAEAAHLAVEGVGRRQLVLGAAEIAVLGSVGLAALYVLLSGGKSSTSEEVRVETGADGTTREFRTRNVTYGVSESLAKVIAAILQAVVRGGGPGGND